MLKKSLLLFLLILAIGCKNDAKQNKDSEMHEDFKNEHNAKVALDYTGVYEGELPCADCEYILFKISLNEDETYYSKYVYMGKSQEVFEEYGTYEWLEDNNSIQLISTDKKSKSQYKVGEGYLQKLSENGEEIESAFKEKYYLSKS